MFDLTWNWTQTYRFSCGHCILSRPQLVSVQNNVYILQYCYLAYLGPVEEAYEEDAVR